MQLFVATNVQDQMNQPPSLLILVNLLPAPEPTFLHRHGFLGGETYRKAAQTLAADKKISRMDFACVRIQFELSVNSNGTESGGKIFHSVIARQP